MLPFLNDDLLRAVVEQVADDSQSPEQMARRAELLGLIQFALDQLPEHYARALELKYIQGCGSQEIAAVIGSSDTAVQSMLARARAAFREVYGEALRALQDQPDVEPGT